MATPKLLEAACKGSHASQGGPDDDGSDENFVYGGPEDTDGPAVQTGAWVADVTYERAPHGEDSLGLWQINIDPAQTDNPDTFDCSEIVQWASGPAVRTGAGIADVTYDEPSSAPPFAKPVTFTATVSNSEPVTHTGWGPWEVVLDGHIEANLVFDSTGGDRSTVLLPYLEQRGGEADDGGFVIDWTTGDGPKGGDTVGVIAIITPTEHGDSVLEFSVENFPNNSSCPALGESASFQGFVIDHGHMGRSFDLVFPTQTAFPEVSGLKIEQDVIEFSPDQAVSVIAIIAPVDLNEVDVGHADLLFSENAPGGAGCSVYLCGQNSPQASPAPVDQRGYAGGHFELVLDGHSSSPANTGYVNPSSFQIVSAGPSPLESDYSGAHALYQDVMIV